jgi:hypothetical protein
MHFFTFPIDTGFTFSPVASSLLTLCLWLWRLLSCLIHFLTSVFCNIGVTNAFVWVEFSISYPQTLRRWKGKNRPSRSVLIWMASGWGSFAQSTWRVLLKGYSVSIVGSHRVLNPAFFNHCTFCWFALWFAHLSVHSVQLDPGRHLIFSS